jgi:hypothetical protein
MPVKNSDEMKNKIIKPIACNKGRLFIPDYKIFETLLSCRLINRE